MKITDIRSRGRQPMEELDLRGCGDGCGHYRTW